MKITSSIKWILLFLCSNALLFAQSNTQNSLWKQVKESSFEKIDSDRQIIPEKYQIFELNITALNAVLQEAPLRFSPDANKKEVILSLPFPDGTYQDFKIYNAPLMHPDLAKKYPEIQTFVAHGIDDLTASVRFDLTPHGFHAMVRSGNFDTYFIDPYAKNQTSHYVCYFKKDYVKEESWECQFDDHNEKKKKPNSIGAPVKAGDCDLRTYRLALACTGEYATFHGGTVPLVLAAMNTSMNRVNGIFENDVTVTMQIVPNNDQIVFLDSGTDPYTNGNGGTMLGQNQTTCDNVIGSANYDIGHVFSTGGGGVAFLQSVCGNNKAGGVTGQSTPVGDPFDVDYVAHEMGHQYGGNHTQNNSCNRNGSTAMEPGSASTIMGYAGICNPNVQNNSDDYFHSISVQEMNNFVTGGGNSCAVITNTGNSQPTVDAGSDHTIPASTFFVLTAIGGDADGTGSLTYCWDQMDNQVATMPPVSTNTNGPAFRSINPSASPMRYFPNLPDIVNNVSPTWEVLASVSRSYSFRATVRDNQAGWGCTEEDDMVVTVNGNSGPFLVTAPNTAVTWNALGTHTVTWDVANSDQAPVNATHVDILLSLDGGFTYPITLATATPNDGTHDVILGTDETTTARIMVRGSGNIFFDISDTDFIIAPPLNDFALAVTPTNTSICAPTDAVFDITIGANGTFSGDVSLSATGLPAGASSSFSVDPVSAPGSSQLTIGNTGGITPGSYSIDISGNGSTGTKTETVTFVVANSAPSAIVLLNPADGATSIAASPMLSWNALGTAANYDLDLATDASFNSIIESQTGLTANSYQVTSALNANSTYYWRVKGNNACGAGTYSSTWSFTTQSIICMTYASTDVPVNISSNGTPTVTSNLNIPDDGNIIDVNVLNLEVDHTWVADLIIDIESPNGTSVNLFSEICGQQNNVDINFDDEAANNHGSIPCPPANGETYMPNQSLSAFDGEALIGNWVMTIEDVFNQDGGALTNWELEICYEPPAPAGLSVSVIGTNIPCNGGSTGSATAIPMGGTPAYSYLWNNGETTDKLSEVPAGTYTVTVTDVLGATATGSITLTQPASALSMGFFPVHTTCGFENGAIGTFLTGGTTPYSHLWSNGATTASISNLASNFYAITTTDGNGCTLSNTAFIQSSIGVNLTTDYSNTICGGNNGMAEATASSGTPGYTYLWSNGLTDAAIDNLAAGIYTVETTDGTGCTATNSVEILSSNSDPTLYTTPTGSFEDGSGIEEYVNGTDCKWLISPTNAISVTLNFSAFDTEPGADVVRIYDGIDNSAPLLAEYSGASIPSSVTSTGGDMFVQFISNTNNTAPGWDANYTSIVCPADLLINDIPIPLPQYDAGFSIMSSGKVAAGSDVKFNAGNNILLDFEFEVELGATFEAITGVGCF